MLVELRWALSGQIKLPRETIQEIEALLREHTVVARPGRHLEMGLADGDDEWIVAAAVAGGAEVLVTGDAELLAAGDRAPLEITSPRGFWELLQRSARTR